MNKPPERSPFKINNIRQFVAFRIFFTSRFYYPVFLILFLDYGLTVEQFALLNVAWAVAIVLCEVPSGALADAIGRRNLLIFAGGAMVIEMALICFVPAGNVTLLLIVFLINRIISGMAEAAASGADEAIAYDSLEEEGNVEDWGKVLEIQMRYKSIAYIGAMSLGAAIYDPDIVNAVIKWFGFDLVLDQKTTLRFPIFMTMIMGIMAFVSALKMKETKKEGDFECVTYESCKTSISDAFGITFNAGRWILNTPAALVIIIATMIFDHSIRMIMTLNSQYLRLIELPEATFGLIGSSMALFGIFIPKIALRFSEHHSPRNNFIFVAIMIFAGLMGMTLFIPYAGLIPAFILYAAFFFLGFFQSFYLNRITDSAHRATVLSFKGLTLNMAYGITGMLYSLLVAVIRSNKLDNGSGLSSEKLEGMIFMESISWFPWYFVVIIALFIFFARRQLKGEGDNIFS